MELIIVFVMKITKGVFYVQVINAKDVKLDIICKVITVRLAIQLFQVVLLVPIVQIA